MSVLSPPPLSAPGLTPPAWLDALRSEDGFAAAAYENTPAPRRALLKSAVAFLFQLWGEVPAEETRRVLSPTAGFAWTIAERPASWALAVLDPEHAAPARLLAALIPAVLAGVDLLLVVCPNRPPAPVQSVALELAGLENVYVLPTDAGADRPSAPALPDLAEELTALGEGRLLLFPTARSRFSPLFQTLRETARRLRLRLWQDSPAPRLALIADAEDAPALRDTWQWAHGDAVLEVFSPNAPPVRHDFDAWCAARPSIFAQSLACAPPLLLGPGLEACWVHERLDPRFFRAARHAVRLHP